MESYTNTRQLSNRQLVGIKSEQRPAIPTPTNTVLRACAGDHVRNINGHIPRTLALACALATGGCSSAGLGIAAAGVAVEAASAVAGAASGDGSTTTVAEAARAIERTDNRTCKKALEKARAAAVPDAAETGVRANVPAVTPPLQAGGRVCRVRLVCVAGRERPVPMRLCRTDRHAQATPEPGFRLPASPSARSEGRWSWRDRGDAPPPSVGDVGS
jgi:hypothetical protein